jgi:purine-nucleoside phosphorylase
MPTLVGPLPRLSAMSTHIGAAPGEIAPTVLMPGDPRRARWIAENFLDDARCHNEVRGMLGYTGTWKGQPVSVQGSGMGQPSLSIYATELLKDYDVSTIIRVGSCGALTEKLAVRDIVLGIGACTDSSMNTLRFQGLAYAPVADFGLLRAAYECAESLDLENQVEVGLLISSDYFYNPRPEMIQKMVEFGVLAVEMEAAALYTLAAQYDARSLALCTVSDHVVTGEETTAQEREQTFGEMVEIALGAALG